MRKLSVFNFITLNGFYKAPGDDISWHVHGDDESEYSKESIGRGNMLLFGRVTYEMMASYWPSKVAKERDPIVAAGMDKAEKVVFSRTLEKADWNNTRIINNNIEEEVLKLKQQPGKDMTILGSGSIVAQLATRDLIDEYQFMVDPVLLGAGSTICNGIPGKINLRLTAIRHFKSGTVLLVYIPMNRSDGED